MADFNAALKWTLDREGRVLTNALADRGGLSYCGLTLATVTAYMGKPVTAAQMAALPDDTVAAIYRKLYWAPIGGDNLTQQIVAMCLFDMSVLMGPVRASMLAQQALGLVMDGKVGPKSIAALNKTGVVAFVNGFSDACDAYLRQIVAKDATQQVWLPGWLKRTSLMDQMTQV